MLNNSHHTQLARAAAVGLTLFALPAFGQVTATGLERLLPTHTPDAGYLPNSDVAFVVLANSAPVFGARFGFDVAALDFDGDGHQDLAVGVPGEFGAGLPGRVDVFRGPKLELTWILTPAAGQLEDLFGTALAAGDLDGDGDDELAVGAPGWDAGPSVQDCGMVTLWDHVERPGSGSLSRPVEIAMLRRAGEHAVARMGIDLVIADVYGGPELDIAIGTPFAVNPLTSYRAGAVNIFSRTSPAAAWTETVWDNPQSTNNHNEFGNRLVAVDWDADGAQDLAVSAIFNAVFAADPCVLPCVDNAGQTYVVLHQAAGAAPVLGAVLDNPFPGAEIQTSQCISERFGMFLDAADLDGDGFGEVFVGANRDDVNGICEAGRGSLFSGAQTGASPLGPHPSAAFTRPTPRVEDLTAYRVLLADLVGGPNEDMLVFSLAALREHTILVWDGDQPPLLTTPPTDAGPPDHEVHALADHGGHFCGGLLATDLDGQGRPELVLGSYDWNLATPALQRTGRVLVTFWP